MEDLREYMIDNTGFIVIYLILVLFISMVVGKKATVGFLGITLFTMIMTNVSLITFNLNKIIGRA